MSELARAVADLERTLLVVQATIDHLPSVAITEARLAQISQLEATRARFRHQLAVKPDVWPEGSSPLTTVPDDQPLLLFLPASLAGPVALADEARAIERALQTTGRLGFRSLADVHPEALLRMFAGDHQRALHMSGRGRDGTLVLHGDDGVPTPVSSGPLTTIVRELGRGLRLVVLHARASRELARAIAATGPCVIALDGAIGATTARLFLEALYRSLGAGRPLDEAFAHGRRALAMVEIADDRMPVLVGDAAGVTLVD